MFIFTWLFDKLGYMPKIDVQVGVVKQTTWPFPATVEIKSLAKDPVHIKPVVKKATTRKPKVAAKTARTKKTK